MWFPYNRIKVLIRATSRLSLGIFTNESYEASLEAPDHSYEYDTSTLFSTAKYHGIKCLPRVSTKISIWMIIKTSDTEFQFTPLITLPCNYDQIVMLYFLRIVIRSTFVVQSEDRRFTIKHLNLSCDQDRIKCFACLQLLLIKKWQMQAASLAMRMQVTIDSSFSFQTIYLFCISCFTCWEILLSSSLWLFVLGTQCEGIRFLWARFGSEPSDAWYERKAWARVSIAWTATRGT